MWRLLNPSTAFCFLAGWLGRAGPSRTVGGPPRGEAFAFDRTRAPDALQPAFAAGRASHKSGDKDHVEPFEPLDRLLLSGGLARARGPISNCGRPAPGRSVCFRPHQGTGALQPAFAERAPPTRAGTKAMRPLLSSSTAFCFLAGRLGRAGPSRTVGGPPRGEAFTFDRPGAPDALQPAFAAGRASRASPEVEMSGKPNHPITANGDAHES